MSRTTFAVVSLGLLAAAAADGVWAFRRSMLYRRSDFSANVLPGFAGNQSLVVLVGGCTGIAACLSDGSCPCSAITNATTAYNPDTDTWVELPQAPIARYRHTAAVVGTKLYVFGGRTLDDTIITEVDVFDASTGVWTITSAWAGATSDLTSFVYGTVIYAIGGYDQNYDAKNSTALFATSNSTWIAAAVANMRVGRGDSCATIVNGKGFVLGGWDDDAGFCLPLDAVEVYDFVANNWTDAAVLHHAAGDQTCGTLHNELLVVGGEQKNGGCSNVSTPIDSVESYNQTGNTWTPEPPMAVRRFRFSAVTWHAAGAGIEQLFVFGGQAPYNATLGTLDLLDIVTVFTDEAPATSGVPTSAGSTTVSPGPATSGVATSAGSTSVSPALTTGGVSASATSTSVSSGSTADVSAAGPSLAAGFSLIATAAFVAAFAW